jgi:flagellar biosynthetic protein FlhB
MTVHDYWLNIPDCRQLAIGLQFFAAEDEGRTEDPTERRVRKAREEGRVAKSQDLAQAAVLFFGLIAVAVMSAWFVRTVITMSVLIFEKTGAAAGNFQGTTFDKELGRIFLRYYLGLCLPVFAVSFIAAFLGNVIQVGFLFTTKPLVPDFKKIIPNFSKYLKRTVFGMEAIYNLGKSILKVLIIGLFSYFVLRGSIEKIIATPFTLLSDSAGFIARRAFFLMMQTAVILLILAVVDVIFQRYQHKESLQMTKRDVREEMKEDLGNPHIRGKIRQRMMELLSANMIQNVPKADVVVTNPTHFAVAIEYTPGAAAPRVTAKGADSIAQNIKRIAAENSVPVIENKPLARALYASVEVGQEIPQEYWEVIIQILTKVYQMTGRRVRGR